MVQLINIDLEGILHASPIPTFIINAEHKIVGWNQAIETLSGVRKEDVLNTSDYSRFFYGENRETMADLLISNPDSIFDVYPNARYSEIEGGYSAEGFFSHIDKWLRFTAVPIKDKKEKTFLAFETVIDITNEKQKEMAVQESEEMYRTIAESVLDSIIEINDMREVTLWNRAAELVLGYSREEAIGKDIFSLIVPEKYSDRYLEALSGYMMGGRRDFVGKIFESKAMRKNGDVFPIELSINTSLRGGQRYTVGVLRDVSERKKIEDEKKVLENKLRQSQKMEAMGTLAGGIAHDINNMLTGMKGYIELIRMEAVDNPSVQARTYEVDKNVNKLANLASTMLMYSREGDVDYRVLDLGLTVKEIIGFVRSSISKGVEIKSDIGRRIYVEADYTQMHQVVLNLCVNAAYAMNNKGSLEIKLEEFSNDACLSIKDTGEGIDADVLDKIYNPYFTTKPVGEGTGMGLAMVNAIVDMHKGRVEVESEKNVGTLFRVYLPIKGQVSKQEVVEETQFVGGFEKILLVEDEHYISFARKEILMELGYDVEIAVNGLEALDLLKESKFDLVLTDFQMPKMDGLELSREVKRLYGLPIVMYTGVVSGDEIDSRNIDVVVKKPLGLNKIDGAIRGLLDEKKGSVTTK